MSTEIIDFHTHDFPDKIAPKTIALLQERSGVTAFRDGTFLSLAESMERDGISHSVLLPVVTKPSQFQTVNEVAAQKNALQSHILSFGGIHPDQDDYKEAIDYIVSLGLKGIKLHPAYQGVYADDIRYLRIISYALEKDLIVSIHAGIDIGLPEPNYSGVTHIKEMLCKTGGGKIVLAHLGGWKEFDAVEELLVGENCYFDTAFVADYISKEQFERIVRKHGVAKILFGTDSPWTSQLESAEWILHLSFTEEEKQMILSGNAKKLLGW